MGDGIETEWCIWVMGHGVSCASLPHWKKRPYLATASQAYHLTVHRLEGDRRFHIALESSGRVADVCGSIGKHASPVRDDLTEVGRTTVGSGNGTRVRGARLKELRPAGGNDAAEGWPNQRG